MRHILLVLSLLWPCTALAAAWTQAEDTWQIISGIVYSDASASFDAHGNSITPTLFHRILEQNDIEYGLFDPLTLYARTETADVQTQSATTPRTDALNNAFELGARWRPFDAPHLLSDYDVFSVEGMVRTAGAFNFNYSANANSAGRAFGLRVLYGSPFTAWGKEGFLNLEAAERWLSHPRPDETAVDVTAGLWLDPHWLVMGQSFNVVSGPARAPYVDFRSHKLEASLAYKFSDRFTLQAGAFLSPAGQNALDERGLCVSLWTNL